ncbi:pancreatic triacylglycerol lipase-like [Clavelina lepadiformis]|uniref:pancreatic triacylglycerol lipase-like n=1 Tax=Clavelina lepadiformis TaxID=159417 RepID=UPI004043940B
MIFAQELKNALLDAEDVNIIVVNWEKGANPKFDYGQACANTRVVGAQLALLMEKLETYTGALPRNFHIMGHSLGAHIAGYAGERLSRLGRITASLLMHRTLGLDPAGPFFEGTEPAVRLDPSDALFVDAIHTDGDPILNLGWGTLQQMGHADFYPNGGRDQPGCPGNEETDGPWWKVTCSHGRACDLMIDSISNQNKPMIGHSCVDYDAYLAGECDICSGVGCAVLGMFSNVEEQATVSVKYYLKTKSEAPFSEEESV